MAGSAGEAPGGKSGKPRKPVTTTRLLRAAVKAVFAEHLRSLGFERDRRHNSPGGGSYAFRRILPTRHDLVDVKFDTHCPWFVINFGSVPAEGIVDGYGERRPALDVRYLSLPKHGRLFRSPLCGGFNVSAIRAAILGREAAVEREIRLAIRRFQQVEDWFHHGRAGCCVSFYYWPLCEPGAAKRSIQATRNYHCPPAALFEIGASEEVLEALRQSSYDTQEMEAAIARARSEVDRFIRELEREQPDLTGSIQFAVKAALEDIEPGSRATDIETYMEIKAYYREELEFDTDWLLGVSFRNGKFRGIGPGAGEYWTVEQSKILDWAIVRRGKWWWRGKMYGNYTLRPRLKTMPEKVAARFRAIIADP